MIRGTGIDSTVKLYLKGNGANGSTKFYDDSQSHKTVTVGGNTQITTTFPVYGNGGSMLFDGDGDYLSVNSSDTSMISGTKSIGVWFNSSIALNSSTSKMSVIASAWDTGKLSWLFRYYLGEITYFQRVGTTDYVRRYVIDFSADTWYYLCFTKVGNDYKMYIDGTLLDSYTYPTLTYNVYNEMYIGAKQDDLTAGWSGKLADFILTNDQILDGTIVPTRRRG